MSKFYVVCAVGWEYNDEYYYRGEEEGGKPEKVFTDPLKAQEYAFEQAGEYLIPEKSTWGDNYYGVTPLQYFYDGSDKTFDVEGLNTDLQAIMGEAYQRLDEHAWQWEVPPGLSETQRVALARLFKHYLDINFYEVVEVEGE